MTDGCDMDIFYDFFPENRIHRDGHGLASMNQRSVFSTHHDVMGYLIVMIVIIVVIMTIVMSVMIFFRKRG